MLNVLKALGERDDEDHKQEGDRPQARLLREFLRSKSGAPPVPSAQEVNFSYQPSAFTPAPVDMMGEDDPFAPRRMRRDAYY